MLISHCRNSNKLLYKQLKVQLSFITNSGSIRIKFISKKMSTTFILITFLLLVTASQQVFAINVKLLVNQNLTDIILKSNDNIIKFPQRSSECFSIYTPKLTALTKDFEDEYLRCQQVADNSTACLHREVQPDEENVVQMRDNICSTLYVCQRNDSSPYDFFECSNEAVCFI